MKIDDITPVSDGLVLAGGAEVDALEQRLWITFPKGYREYVTRLGEGTLGGSLVRVYPPWRIADELDGWRQRIDRYWFWDDGSGTLPKARALECVVIGDTVNGDELVFHPARPDRIFVLPRDEEVVYDAGPDLLEAADWICSCGKFCEPFDERDFEPHDSRLWEKSETDAGSMDPKGESISDIDALMKAWVKRHGVTRKANTEMKKHVGKANEAKLLFRGLCLEGSSKMDAGEYLAYWQLVDKQTGEETGWMKWTKGEFSEGFELSPPKKKS